MFVIFRKQVVKENRTKKIFGICKNSLYIPNKSLMFPSSDKQCNT